MTWLFGVFFQKFILFAYFVFCAAVVALCHKLPDCRLKRLLLMKV